MRISKTELRRSPRTRIEFSRGELEGLRRALVSWQDSHALDDVYFKDRRIVTLFLKGTGGEREQQ